MGGVIPFKKEQFRTLIVNTYDEFFVDRSNAWEINDYMDVVINSNCEDEFGLYLQDCKQNKITLSSFPCLDLGDKPLTYNARKAESEQIYIVPKSNYTETLVVTYSDCKPVYLTKGLFEKY